MTSNQALQELAEHVRSFAVEREWGQFHTPKNLAMALAGEAGELLEIFQWLTPQEAAAVMGNPRQADAVRHELADVFSYLLRLADVLEVDLEAALRDKLALNADKYPVDRARGNARKYTDLGDAR